MSHEKASAIPNTGHPAPTNGLGRVNHVRGSRRGTGGQTASSGKRSQPGPTTDLAVHSHPSDVAMIPENYAGPKGGNISHDGFLDSKRGPNVPEVLCGDLVKDAYRDRQQSQYIYFVQLESPRNKFIEGATHTRIGVAPRESASAFGDYHSVSAHHNFPLHTTEGNEEIEDIDYDEWINYSPKMSNSSRDESLRKQTNRLNNH